MKQMKKVLVTGGRGFLGHHIVNALKREGVEVVVYDEEGSEWAAHPSRYPKWEEKGVLNYYGDVLDTYGLGLAMAGCDTVFHNAAIADIEEAASDPSRTMEVNVLGTSRVLETAAKCGVKRVVYASSVYTMGKRGSFYRISKQAGEALCKSFDDEYDLPYTIVKYGSLYGHEANHWNFIYRVCKELLEKGEYCYQSAPDAIREFIHVSDAARETVRIADDPEFVNASVLITGHTKMRMSEFFDMITEIIGGGKVTYEEPEKRRHYVYTPYSFDPDVPVRINMPTYIDVTEGILDCLKRVHEELSHENRD